MKYPNFTEENKSLMAKHLTKDVFEKLNSIKTKNGFSLEDVIKSGLENPDSSIGAYAGDSESYKAFALLFDEIIKSYHGFSKNDTHKSDSSIFNIPNSDPKNKYIISTRIRVGRNLAGFPLGTAISKKKRLQVETVVSNALTSLDGDLAGKYYSLENMSTEVKHKLIKEHFLFKEGDRFLQSAGLNRHWPSGRGIFHNYDKTFLVWINEEDQLRIISMQKGGDIKKVFERLTKALSKLEKSMKFAHDKHLGYITSCPTNLGTAMRASVHIRLPKLAKNMELFKNIVNKHNLQIRGIDGEHSKSQNAIFDISNKRRLGISEAECIKDLYYGVVDLINTENKA